MSITAMLMENTVLCVPYTLLRALDQEFGVFQ